MKRVISIDIVRGLVMIIMALDHVRDLMHVHSIGQSPTDLSSTTPTLFFTRWITYLCAPIFVFLAGSSAFLSLKNKGDLSAAGRFLIKRGLVLILLEFTVVNFGLFFDIGWHTLIFEVIASTGFGFIILGLLLKLSPKQLGVIGLLILFGHNLIPLTALADTAMYKTWLLPFFSPTAIPLFAGKIFVMAYPPIPWLGIMLLGYACGPWFGLPEDARRKLFLRTGLSALALFVLLRFVNVYGDPAHWSVQHNAVYTFLSFMNVTKYPPSLLFCLVNLGIMFLLLAIAEHAGAGFTRVTTVYGKVPMFYFIVHFYMIHCITIVVLLLQGFHWSQLEFATGSFGRPNGVISGLSLSYIYLIWIGVVVALYLPCKWYGEFKMTHQQGWLRYL